MALDPNTLIEGESTQAGEASVLASCERRRMWAGDGGRSASAWLAHETGHSKADRGGRIRLGRTMVHMPGHR